MTKNRTKNRNGIEKTEQAGRRLGFRLLLKNTFHCLDCGNLNQADYNSSLNIKLIAVAGVLRAELLKLDKNGRFVPKSNKKDFVRLGYQKSEFSLFVSYSNTKAPEVFNLLSETQPFRNG